MKEFFTKKNIIIASAVVVCSALLAWSLTALFQSASPESYEFEESYGEDEFETEPTEEEVEMEAAPKGKEAAPKTAPKQAVKETPEPAAAPGE